MPRTSTGLILLSLVAASGFSGCGSAHTTISDAPQSRLIVLGHSIAGIRIGELRASVENAFGPGRSARRGVVRYFGGRLVVDYWTHDQLQNWVGGLETTWSGFRTRSGIRVGSARQELPRGVGCNGRECGLAARPMPPPDAPGTVFTMRRGHVVKIDVFYG